MLLASRKHADTALAARAIFCFSYESARCCAHPVTIFTAVADTKKSEAGATEIGRERKVVGFAHDDVGTIFSKVAGGFESTRR